jgi:hypothetical protein
MTKNASIGGVLSIISGVFGILGLISCLMGAIMVNFILDSDLYGDMYGGMYGGMYGNMDISSFIVVVCIISGVICGILGIISIIGGAMALKKNNWGLALAGSICGILSFFPTGIPAVIFTAIGKPEFDKPIAPISPSQNPG